MVQINSADVDRYRTLITTTLRAIAERNKRTPARRGVLRAGRLVWLTGLLALLMACAPNTDRSFVPDTAVATVGSPAAVTHTATAIVPTRSHTPVPTPTAPTGEPSPTPSPPATATPIPTATPPAIPVRLITDEPIFTGGDLYFRGWSPDGRYLTYFEYSEAQVAESPVEGLRGVYPGTFVIYDTQTGVKCTDYALSGYFPYEGGEAGAPWRWLPDGSLLIQVPGRAAERTAVPCTPGAPIAVPSIASIESSSPDGQKLLLTTNEHYLIYDWSADSALPIAELAPTHFNNLVWSPDGRHIGVTLAGNYTGERDPVGGTRVVDVSTGAIIARHDWVPANALDGTFGGPVWIDNETFVVTLSLDQGPFFMTIAGEVTPLLPLFNVTFNPENYWPPVDVHAAVEDDAWAILHQDGRSGNSQLLTVQAGVQTIEQLGSASAYRLLTGGVVGYQGDDGRYWTRSVFDTGGAFTVQAAAYDPWLAQDARLSFTSRNGSIAVFDSATGTPIEILEFADYGVSYNFQPHVSPDEVWIAVFVKEPRWAYGRALFLVSALP